MVDLRPAAILAFLRILIVALVVIDSIPFGTS